MRPDEIRNKNVLISPLNWGMGHVARCIGLIQQLNGQGNNLIVACNEEQERIFREYFPELVYVHHSGYPFKFGGTGNFEMDLLKAILPLRKRMHLEMDEVNRLVEVHQIDIVISDHRYGFRSALVTSIFLTHQLSFPLKWYNHFVNRIHWRLLKRFDQIWVMDFPDSKLAGKLSKNNRNFNAHYIGPYSRFQLYQHLKSDKKGTVIVASGPEVYAKQFLKDQLERYQDLTDFSIICSATLKDDITYKCVASTWKAQDEVILKANQIISRSGYSTIMDLYFLETNATLIPTPGQKEQLYLSKNHPEYHQS